MKRNKKLITLILLSLLCLGLAVTGSLAAFTKTNYVKRVVSTKAGSSDQWSSNYLQPLTIDTDPVIEQTYRLGSSLDLGITVCNYPQGDMTKYSSSDITFTLKLLLENKNDANVIADIESKIFIKSASDSSVGGTKLSSYDQGKTYTLSGGAPSTMLFSFTCSEDAVQVLSDCILTVKAVPTSSSEIKTLASAFRFTTTSKAKTAWTGEFVRDPGVPKDLDAFNYEMKGTARGIITLTIDTSKVQISRFSYEELKSPPYPSDVPELEFNVGEEGQPTRYVIQFYRTSEDNRENEIDWDSITDYVHFDFDETLAPTE